MNITWHEGRVTAEFPPQHEECGRKAFGEGKGFWFRVKGTNFAPAGQCAFCKQPAPAHYKEGVN